VKTEPARTAPLERTPPAGLRKDQFFTSRSAR
jgi:hypothetical protein